MSLFLKLGGALLLILLSASHTDAQDTLEKGIQLFQDGKPTQARRVFELLLEQETANPTVAFYLGRIAFDEQDHERAIGWFEKSLDTGQCQAEYYVWLGRAYGYYTQQANVFRQPFLAKKVQKLFERAVSCDPNHIAARWDLMEYYLRAPGFLGGSTKKAKEQATAIQQRDPQEGQKAWELVAELDK